jgi:hypothetical protein
MGLERKTKQYLIELVGSHQRSLSRQHEEIKQLRQQIEEMEAHQPAEDRYGPGGKDREPETEVGYLRRELSYAQGQLHQSHLTVKQLCGRALLAEQDAMRAALGKVDEKVDGLLDRFNNLLLRWEGLAAERNNTKDLADAGITTNDTTALRAPR